MTGYRRAWLDDDAAERLLSGESAGPRHVAAVLSAARAPLPFDPAGEEAALAAFRDAGRARRAGRRRRPRLGHAAKAALGVAMAGLAVGGVAVAAGAVTFLTPFGRSGDRATGHSGLSASGPTVPGTVGSVRPEGSGTGTTGDALPSRSWADGAPSATGKDERAGARDGHIKADALLRWCRTYESPENGGRAALDAEAFSNLVRAAGGEQRVDTYCRQRLSDSGQQGQQEGSSDSSQKPKPAQSGDGGGDQSSGVNVSDPARQG